MFTNSFSFWELPSPAMSALLQPQLSTPTAVLPFMERSARCELIVHILISFFLSKNITEDLPQALDRFCLVLPHITFGNLHGFWTSSKLIPLSLKCLNRAEQTPEQALSSFFCPSFSFPTLSWQHETQTPLARVWM